jgi:hypothetical protein
LAAATDSSKELPEGGQPFTLGPQIATSREAKAIASLSWIPWHQMAEEAEGAHAPDCAIGSLPGA